MRLVAHFIIRVTDIVFAVIVVTLVIFTLIVIIVIFFTIVVILVVIVVVVVVVVVVIVDIIKCIGDALLRVFCCSLFVIVVIIIIVVVVPLLIILRRLPGRCHRKPPHLARVLVEHVRTTLRQKLLAHLRGEYLRNCIVHGAHDPFSLLAPRHALVSFHLALTLVESLNFRKNEAILLSFIHTDVQPHKLFLCRKSASKELIALERKLARPLAHRLDVFEARLLRNALRLAILVEGVELAKSTKCWHRRGTRVLTVNVAKVPPNGHRACHLHGGDVRGALQSFGCRLEAHRGCFRKEGLCHLFRV
mmetsp:Transcript_5301/g.13379  ORF Transcript_5301/g.13379 Transcript_5301/m.13379 type:complete len:305 (+) Transcript_5301:202-1116(+)